MIQYLSWHYGKACLDWRRVYSASLSFVPNFFSIKNLLVTLFDPWGGPLTWLFGVILKLIFIIFGLLVWFLVAILGPIFLVIWLILPLLEIVIIPGSLISILFF